jgi:hypothetical protein
MMSIFVLNLSVGEGYSYRNMKCLKVFMEMKLCLVCMCLNGLKDAQTFVRTLKILQRWAAVEC